MKKVVSDRLVVKPLDLYQNLTAFGHTLANQLVDMLKNGEIVALKAPTDKTWAMVNKQLAQQATRDFENSNANSEALKKKITHYSPNSPILAVKGKRGIRTVAEIFKATCADKCERDVLRIGNWTVVGSDFAKTTREMITKTYEGRNITNELPLANYPSTLDVEDAISINYDTNNPDPVIIRVARPFSHGDIKPADMQIRVNPTVGTTIIHLNGRPGRG